jgi:small conductance mechanosensitive channel
VPFPLLAQIPAQLSPREAVEAIPDAASLLHRRIVELAPASIVAVLLFALFWLFGRGVSRILDRAFDRTHADPALRGLTLRLVRFFILLLGLLAAGRQLGLEVGSLVAGLGIVGLAVGMAAQDLLANLIAGFTILWDRPFRVGDVVTIGSINGQVVEIGLRTTRLRAGDQKLVILPNREAISETVVNHTESRKRRLDVRLTIAYDQPIEPVRELLVGLARGQAGFEAEPAPEVAMVAFAEAGVDIELRAVLKDAHEEGAVRSRLLEAIKVAFDGAGIAFPLPQRTFRLLASSPQIEPAGQLGAPSGVAPSTATPNPTAPIGNPEGPAR